MEFLKSLFKRLSGGDEFEQLCNADNFDFAAQLGLPVEKWDDASLTIKFVAYALSLYLSGEGARGFELLRDKRMAEAVWPRYEPSGKHAYVYTEIVELALSARGMFVLPPSSALSWLRTVDPVLYGILISLGRRIAPMLCAGIIAHHMAEQDAGHSIVSPMVNTLAGQRPVLAKYR